MSLIDLHVVDLSFGIAGGYCSKLLTDAGADVVKVEPTSGDPWRRWSVSRPDPWSYSGDEGAPLWRFLHHGQRSVVGDPGTTQVDALMRSTDLVIDGGRLQPDQIRELVDAGVVVLSITPFGLAGPYAERPATEFTTQAESGGVAGRGHPDWPPFQCGGRTSEWVSGTFAAVAGLAASLGARRSGRGEHIDFSMIELMNIAGSVYADLMHSLSGRPPLTGPSRTLETPSIEPTLDGYVGFNTNTQTMFEAFCVMIERPELMIDDPSWAFVRTRTQRFDEWNEIVHAWTTQHTSAEIVELATALRIPVAHVNSGATVTDMDQFRARGVFVDDPTGTFTMPRRPWQLDFETPPPPRRAPRLGEHTDSTEPWSRTRPAPGRRRASARGCPSRRSDRMVGWALCLPHAGHPGCRGHPRRGHPTDRQHAAHRRHLRHERGLVGAQRDLLPGQLQQARPHPGPQHRAGTGAATRPDRSRSDVVIENFTPRVMDNFGLTWERIAAANPQATLVRMPAFGLSGPWRDNMGFAQTMEQMTGMAWVTGFPDDQPRIQRGPSDPNAGMHAAFATIVALAAREQSGRGHHLEVTMVEGALNASAEQVIEYTAHGVVLERDGNRSPGAAPQGLYPAAGDDNWLAISVETDAQWEALVHALGSPTWATDPALPRSSVGEPDTTSSTPGCGRGRPTRTSMPPPSCSPAMESQRRERGIRASPTNTHRCGPAVSTSSSTTRWPAPIRCRRYRSGSPAWIAGFALPRHVWASTT